MPRWSRRPLWLLPLALLLGAPAGGATPAAGRQAARVDQYGDPLPEGAVARLGTTRLRQGAWIEGIALSPDGKTLAAGGADDLIRLWDAATGRQLRVLRGHTWYPRALAFSADGRTLASGSEDRDPHPIRLWDTATGREVGHCGEAGGSGVTTLAFSPDGKWLASASWTETIRLWDAATGKEVRTFRTAGGKFYTLTFSPDGRTLASYSGQAVHLWEAATGKELRRIKAGTDLLLRLTFVREGRVLLTADGEHGVRFWDVKTGEQTRQARAPGKGGSPAALSPSGRFLAWLDSNLERLTVWDAEAGKELWRTPPDQIIGLAPVAFSADGRTLARGWREGVIRVWDVNTGKDRPPPAGHAAPVQQTVFLPDGRTLASRGEDDKVRVWDVPSARELRVLPGGFLSPDGRRLATVEEETTVRVLDTATGKEVSRFRGHRKEVGAAAFSPGGETVVSADEGGIVHVWDAATGKPRHKADASGLLRGVSFDLPYTLAFSADGKVLVAGGLVGGQFVSLKLRAWSLATGEVLGSTKGQDFSAAALSPDGKILALVGYDSKAERPAVLLRDLPGRKNLRWIPWGNPQPEFPAVPDPTPPLALSPDGRLVTVLAAREDVLCLHDVATGKLLRELGGHRGGIGPALFSADGRTLATLDGDRTARLWEVATGQERCRFEGHRGYVGCLSFSPDGRALATGGSDTTVLVWDVTGLGRRRTRLSPEELDRAWRQLAGGDARQAHRAVWSLVDAAAQSVPFLRRRLKPAAAPEARHLAGLVADLNADEYAVRRKATEELEEWGELAGPALRLGLRGKPALEMRRRIERLLQQIDRQVPGPRTLQSLRAVEILEHVATPDAREVLESLAKGAAEARLTREAKAALGRLARLVNPVPGSPRSLKERGR